MMHIRVHKAQLLTALKHVKGVIEKNNANNALANVILDGRTGIFGVSATDREIIIGSEPCVCDVVVTEGITVSAVNLYETVRKLSDDVQIELLANSDGTALTLKAGKFEATLVASPLEAFPFPSRVYPEDFTTRFNISAQALKKIVDKTRFAMSTDETRPHLNGVYLHIFTHDNKQTLRAVATDGYRLAIVEESLPEHAENMPSVIIPRKAIGELHKLLSGAVGPVMVQMSNTQIRLEFHAGVVNRNYIRVISKFVDGTFPEYARVIPKNNDKKLHVSKRAFADAVARVSAVTSERSKPVKLTLAKDSLILSASSPEQGTASEVLDPSQITYKSTELEISFQAKYLQDILKHIDGDVEFLFSDATSPATISETGQDGTFYVLMPKHVA